MCVFLVSYRGLLTLSVLGGNLPVPTHVPVAIVSASLMDFSHLVSFSSLCLPLLFLPYHIHVFPLGLIKRLSSRGEGRRAERGEEKRGDDGSKEEWSLLPHTSGQGRVEWRSSSS